MLDKNLKEWLENCRKNGVSLQDINKALQSRGYSEPDIQKITSPSKPKGKLAPITAGIILIIGIILVFSIILGISGSREREFARFISEANYFTLHQPTKLCNQSLWQELNLNELSRSNRSLFFQARTALMPCLDMKSPSILYYRMPTIKASQKKLAQEYLILDDSLHNSGGGAQDRYLEYINSIRFYEIMGGLGIFLLENSSLAFPSTDSTDATSIFINPKYHFSFEARNLSLENRRNEWASLIGLMLPQNTKGIDSFSYYSYYRSGIILARSIPRNELTSLTVLLLARDSQKEIHFSLLYPLIFLRDIDLNEGDYELKLKTDAQEYSAKFTDRKKVLLPVNFEYSPDTLRLEFANMADYGLTILNVRIFDSHETNCVGNDTLSMEPRQAYNSTNILIHCDLSRYAGDFANLNISISYIDKANTTRTINGTMRLAITG